ncbi:RAN protein binding protein [Rhodotorula toruloides]|uniref:RAN protein binding protein n=1 Tax=Rhodotorula toruloides TaxID=5286 RepID=A0A511KCD6_RHOTO|nr:RAN protein binding protein [Rhodotorula toruloides]
MAATDGTDKKSDATDSARIGWAFLSQYYSFLNKDPARLHCFYTKRSTLIHGTEGEDSTPCYGQQEIHAKIMSLKLEDCKVYISNVDSQSSAEGGIIVQVLGELSNANGPWRKFVQTFFLAEQPNGYFVLNDICRYIKEEGDESSETPTPAAQHPAAHDAAPASVQSILFDDKANLFTNDTEEQTQAQAVPEQSHGDDSFTFHARDFPSVTTNGISSEQLPAETHPEHPDAIADAPEPAASPEAVEAEPTAEESTPAQPEKAEAPADANAPAAEQAPVEQPEMSEVASPPAPASASAAASASAPAPAAPAPAPKSWASLAASNSTKWGRLSNDSKGVSSAASSAPPPATERSPAPAAAAPSATTQPQFIESVMAIRTPSCFVKGVLETVSEQALKDTLISRFGPLKEVDIVRNKACAFIEFEKVDHARRAIQTSLRQSEGGEGGIMVTVDPATGAQTRINIVERKPHDQRPKRTDGATRGGRGGSTGNTGARAGARGGRMGTSARGGAAAK